MAPSFSQRNWHAFALFVLGLAVYAELPLLSLDFRHGVQDEARGEREGGHEHECRGEDGGRKPRYEAGGEVFGHYRHSSEQAADAERQGNQREELQRAVVF